MLGMIVFIPRDMRPLRCKLDISGRVHNMLMLQIGFSCRVEMGSAITLPNIALLKIVETEPRFCLEQYCGMID